MFHQSALVALVLFPFICHATRPLTHDGASNAARNSHHASFYLPAERSVFYHLAKKAGTDKVTAHKYEHLYTKAFEMSGKRFLPLKILEIGLGCNMVGGLWLQRCLQTSCLTLCSSRPPAITCLTIPVLFPQAYGPGKSAQVW